MKRATLLLSAVGLCTGLLLAAVPQEGPCGVSKVEKGWWCEKCNAATEKADLDKDGKHKCGTKPVECELCVKTCWECCGKKVDKKTECKKCTPKEVTVKARVCYKCENCGMKADKEGDCTMDACKKDGKKCKKTCSESGKFPHSTKK